METLNRLSNSTEMILLTIQILLKFIEVPFPEHVSVFLKEIRKKANYWKQIELTLEETTRKSHPTTSLKQKKKNNKIVLHRNDQELWQQVLNLCSAIINNVKLPSNFLKNILSIIDANKNELLNLTQFKTKFEELLVEDESTGQECDFKDIYPTLEELKSTIDYSNVKSNVIKGRFNSVQHYLNIQLTLLREDFLSPLRSGICKLMENGLKSNLNVRVYSNVRILIKQNKSQNSFNKSNLKNEHLMVDLEAKRRAESITAETITNIKYSKKLMYGSMLCFTTSAKFDDLVIAVVSNRDVDLLNQGYVC